MFIIGLVGRISVFISFPIYFYTLRLLKYPLFRTFSSSNIEQICFVCVRARYVCGFGWKSFHMCIKLRALKKFNEHSIRRSRASSSLLLCLCAHNTAHNCTILPKSVFVHYHVTVHNCFVVFAFIVCSL